MALPCRREENGRPPLSRSQSCAESLFSFRSVRPYRTRSGTRAVHLSGDACTCGSVNPRAAPAGCPAVGGHRGGGLFHRAGGVRLRPPPTGARGAVHGLDLPAPAGASTTDDGGVDGDRRQPAGGRGDRRSAPGIVVHQHRDGGEGPPSAWVFPGTGGGDVRQGGQGRRAATPCCTCARTTSRPTSSTRHLDSPPSSGCTGC